MVEFFIFFHQQVKGDSFSSTLFLVVFVIYDFPYWSLFFFLPVIKKKIIQHGETVAVINDFEIYANRKEEIVSRVFGVIDPGHPYIEHIYSGGDWLIGGEIELIDRIRWVSLSKLNFLLYK